MHWYESKQAHALSQPMVACASPSISGLPRIASAAATASACRYRAVRILAMREIPAAANPWPLSQSYCSQPVDLSRPRSSLERRPLCPGAVAGMRT
jgi:hypothetical protein